MPFCVRSDEIQSARPTSIPAYPVGSGTSSRVALGDITNSQRLNRSRLEKPQGKLVSKKGHKRSRAISGPILDTQKSPVNAHGSIFNFSPEDYSQVDPELDDAANERSQISVDTAIDPETFKNMHINSPYLDRPTKNGLKEMNCAILGREVQPIEEPFGALKLDYYLQPRTDSKREKFAVGDDETYAQIGAEYTNHSSDFAYALAERSSCWPFSRQETNKIIEHWLETSSSLWNAEVRLSISRITPIGEELNISELETAAEFDELNLPSLDRLISVIECIGKGPENETKEIVVDILRSPETASKFRGLNLPILLERFDSAINRVHGKQEGTEVSKAYNLARAEIEDQAFSVTPESFGGISGLYVENKDSGFPEQLSKFNVTKRNDPLNCQAYFVTTVEVKGDSSNSLPSLVKKSKRVSFASEATIITLDTSCGEHDPTPLFSTEIVKEAKGISRAACNVVPGMQHIQKQLLDRMELLDRQFSCQAAFKSAKRKTMLSPCREMPYGLDGTMEEASDTSFDVSPDGWISAPLHSHTLLAVSINESREVHGTFSRIKWKRDWEFERAKYQQRRASRYF